MSSSLNVDSDHAGDMIAAADADVTAGTAETRLSTEQSPITGPGTQEWRRAGAGRRGGPRPGVIQ